MTRNQSFLLVFLLLLIPTPTPSRAQGDGTAPSATVLVVADGLPAACREVIKSSLDDFWSQSTGTQVVYLRGSDHKVLADVTLQEGSRATRKRRALKEFKKALEHLDDASHAAVPESFRGQVNLGSLPVALGSIGLARARVVVIGTTVDYSPTRKQWSMRGHRVPSFSSITDPTSTSTFATTNLKPVASIEGLLFVSPTDLEGSSGESLIHQAALEMFYTRWAAAALPNARVAFTNEVAGSMWRSIPEPEPLDEESPIYDLLDSQPAAGVIELNREEDREADFEFFGIGTNGTTAVFVMDRSQSMQGEPFTTAKRELCRSLEALAPTKQYAVCFYCHTTQWLGSELTKASPEAVHKSVNDIQAIGTGPGTNHYGALKEALARRPSVIFLLTDADPDSDLTPEQHSELLAAAETTKSTIHLLRCGKPSPGGRLEDLALQTGGKSVNVNSR